MVIAQQDPAAVIKPKKQTYDDSYVVVWHGPRRGGKTVSMSHDGGVDMLLGRPCFSNYPIVFDYYNEITGKVENYASSPLIEDELLHIDKPDIKRKYMNSTVVWDEAALSLYSRNFMEARNRLMGLVITLIGKLEMNFYFGVQFLSLLDKNIKLQMDALVYCSDLSFKYKKYERGELIGQTVQDISGRFTGEMYEHSGKTYYQTFYAKPFWDIYNTKETFPILRKRISMSGLRSSVSGEAGEASPEEIRIINESIIEHLVAELKAQEYTEMRQGLLHTMAKERGFQGRPQDMGVILMRLGARTYADKARVSVWDIENCEGENEES